MFCRYCGKEISDEASFCNGCGKEISHNRSSEVEGDICTSKEEETVERVDGIEGIENNTNSREKKLMMVGVLSGVIIIVCIVAMVLFWSSKSDEESAVTVEQEVVDSEADSDEEIDEAETEGTETFAEADEAEADEAEAAEDTAAVEDTIQEAADDEAEEAEIDEAALEEAREALYAEALNNNYGMDIEGYLFQDSDGNWSLLSTGAYGIRDLAFLQWYTYDSAEVIYRFERLGSMGEFWIDLETGATVMTSYDYETSENPEWRYMVGYLITYDWDSATQYLMEYQDDDQVAFGWIEYWSETDAVFPVIESKEAYKEKLLQSASEAGIDWDLHSSNNFEWVVIE